MERGGKRDAIELMREGASVIGFTVGFLWGIKTKGLSYRVYGEHVFFGGGGFERKKRSGIAFILWEDIPCLGGSKGEIMDSFKSAGGFSMAAAGGVGTVKVMGKFITREKRVRQDIG